MPCKSDHMEHTAREAESGRVLEFLKEIAGQPFDHDHPAYYGSPATLDADTARLCAWCHTHEGAKHGWSLELQLWWQQHQKADAAREERERQDAEQARLKGQAIDKLTVEERLALGLNRK